MSLYYRDPDDNGVELSIDNVEPTRWGVDARAARRNPIGVPLDPDDIAQKYHAAVAEAELRRFESKPLKRDAEMLRRMIE